MRNLLMFVVAVSLSSLVLAQNGHLYQGATIGYLNWDDDRFAGTDDEAGGQVGLQLGYEFANNRRAVELGASTELTGPEIDLYELSLLNFFGQNENSSRRPYWIAGFAFSDNDEDDSVDDNVFSGLIGVGLSGFIDRRTEIRGDIRAYPSIDNDADDGGTFVDFGVNIAFNYHFRDHASGSSSRSAPAPVATPAPQPEPARRVAPAPAPPAAEVAETRTITIRLNVEFETNSANVAAVYGDEIQEVANAMRAQSDLELVLEGHTDDRGSDVYNQGLSQRRVEAVKQVLVSQYGIDANRVSAVGYGEARPIADNTTADGRARNRRVVGVISWEETAQ